MRISLKAGDRIYINGAVLQADRKVSLQLLNNATFLLGGHVLQVEEATTPLRQLYFVAQTLLIDPAGEGDALVLFDKVHKALCVALAGHEIAGEIDEVGCLVRSGNAFAALKRIRGLYPIEEELMAGSEQLSGLVFMNNGMRKDGSIRTEP